MIGISAKMAFYFCWNFKYLNERRTVLMNWFSIWFIYLSLSDCSHIAVKRWTKDNVETNSICLSLRSGFWQFRLSLQLFVLECKCYKILSFPSDSTYFFSRKKNIAHGLLFCCWIFERFCKLKAVGFWFISEYKIW